MDIEMPMRAVECLRGDHISQGLPLFPIERPQM